MAQPSARREMPVRHSPDAARRRPYLLRYDPPRTARGWLVSRPASCRRAALLGRVAVDRARRGSTSSGIASCSSSGDRATASPDGDQVSETHLAHVPPDHVRHHRRTMGGLRVVANHARTQIPAREVGDSHPVNSTQRETTEGPLGWPHGTLGMARLEGWPASLPQRIRGPQTACCIAVIVHDTRDRKERFYL
jgi:hypothetical protein